MTKEAKSNLDLAYAKLDAAQDQTVIYGDRIVIQAARIAELERQLGELLAVHHGDGGHYLAEHGPEKSVKYALEKWTQVLVAKDKAEYELAELRSALVKAEGYWKLELYGDLKAARRDKEAAEARALAAEAAIKSALGCLDDPTGGTHIEDMRNAAEHLRRALPQPKVTT